MILRRWLRPADCGIFDSVVTIEGVKRLIAEHLAFSGGLGSLIQKKRFDDLIGHLHKNVLFAKWIILFEIDGLHRHALTLFEKGHHSSGAYSADPDGWKR